MPLIASGGQRTARIYAYNENDNEWKHLLVQNDEYNNLRVSVSYNNNMANVGNTTDAESTAGYVLFTKARLQGFNGSTWDRIRTHFYNSLSATSTGALGQFNSLTGFSKHTWLIAPQGNSTNVTVKLQGSIIGGYWFDLDSYTGSTETMRHVVNKPVRYVRFYVSDIGDASSIILRYFGMR